MVRFKKKIKTAILIPILLCAFLTVTAYLFVMQLDNVLLAENNSYLHEVAQQSAKAINNRLNGDMKTLQAMAIMLEKQDTLDLEYWANTLDSEKQLNCFQEIGMFAPDGMGIGDEVLNYDVSKREYFKRAMAGECYISSVENDSTSGEPANTCAVPVYHNGEIVAVLAGMTYTKTYMDILDTNVFKGRGYVYIVENDGAVVLHSNHPDSDKHFGNFFDAVTVSDKAKDEVRIAMEKGESGRLAYNARGEKRYMNYVPLGINDWYVMSVIPNEVIEEKSHDIITIVGIAAGVVLFVFAGLLVAVMVERSISKKKLFEAAYRDELTGIPNKSFFVETGEKLMANSKNNYAYVIMDIKKFKIVNDVFGFEQGDLLLKHIATVLEKTYNKDEGELISRFNSDIFHMLLIYESNLELEKHLNEMAYRVAKFRFAADINYHLSLSFGIYVIENNNDSLKTMGDKARIALQSTGQIKSVNMIYYNDDIRSKIIVEHEVESDMQRAIDEEEFKVYLQPKYLIKTETIGGAEALVRWHHPHKGVIPPDYFIPLFEKNGFVTTLDMYMLEHVCKLIRDWIDAGNEPVVASVNQSRLHLYDNDYLETVIGILKKYNIKPELIELEITESAFFEDTSKMVDLLNELHSLGFKISMDDFGSGYSSLNMLKEIMVDVIKIDKNFFNKNSDTIRGRTIVNSIIALASNLNITVVAEGVETKEQIDFLRATDCDLVQGYYYAKPMPFDEFEKSLKKVNGKMPED